MGKTTIAGDKHTPLGSRVCLTVFNFCSLVEHFALGTIAGGRQTRLRSHVCPTGFQVVEIACNQVPRFASQRRSSAPKLVASECRSGGAVISGCKNDRHWQNALLLLDRFDEMHKAGATLGSANVGTSVFTCEKGGERQHEQALFDKMHAASTTPNLMSCNTAMLACEEAGNWKDALVLLDTMRAAEATSDVVSFSAAISACERGSAWQHMLKLRKDMSLEEEVLYASSFSAALLACQQRVEWLQALSMLDEMQAAGRTADGADFRAALLACEQGGQWQRALQLLSDMNALTLTPDVINFGAVIAATAKGGQWQQALSLFEELRATGLTVDLSTYNAAISACERCGRWQRALSLLDDMRDAVATPSVTSFSKAILACDTSGQQQHSLFLLDEAVFTSNIITLSTPIPDTEQRRQRQCAHSLLEAMTEGDNKLQDGVEWNPVALAYQSAAPLLDPSEGASSERLEAPAHSTGEHAPVGPPDIVDNIQEWNRRAKERFPDQPALRIDQFDLLDQNADPLLAEFWIAVRSSLNAHQQGHREFSYRMTDEKMMLHENQDAREHWYLTSHEATQIDFDMFTQNIASQISCEISGEDMDNPFFTDATAGDVELIAGMPSSEIPGMRLLLNFDAIVRIPAKLLNAYKAAVINFILSKRPEVRAILDRERNEKGNEIGLSWEHKVLRRSFDGEFLKQPKLRFHRDSVPEDITNGTLCSFTIITVLENCDPNAEEDPLGNSMERAGTVFKLDTLFGLGERENQNVIVINASAPPEQGDGFMYLRSRSNAGIATVFCNSNDVSCWALEDDKRVKIEYSWTPQMAHSVAEIEPRAANGSQGRANGRSRTILQSKLAICTSLEASNEDWNDAELTERLELIGLGPYLSASQASAERRFDDLLGPYTLQEFLDYYEDNETAMARWNSASISPFAHAGAAQGGT